jgi:protein phosphatase
VADSDEQTRTEDAELVEQLRSQGILGPFSICDWAALSDRGLSRPNNEDRWLGDPETGFVVADGMGGHAGGELAADTAVRAAFERLAEFDESSAREHVDRVNAAVVRVGTEQGVEGLGTTLVAVANRRTHVVVVSVGDSRVYRCRDGELEALTHDHSVRNELLAAGVSLDEAEQARVRLDALTAFIGQRSQFPPAFRVASYSVMSGDRLLLCTDGIHGQIDEAAMLSGLAAPSCRAAAQELIDAAERAGGRDNATAVVVEFAPDAGAPA